MIIYFPRSFATTYNMINVIRNYYLSHKIKLTIIVSHPDKNSLTLMAADIKLIEPSYNAEENEVFYTEDGSPQFYSEHDEIVGNNKDEIISILEMMLSDAKKKRTVLTEEDFKKEEKNEKDSIKTKQNKK